MDGTILCQGTFTARFHGTNPNPGVAAAQAGDRVIIEIPSNADWLKVYDYTQSGTFGNSAAWFQGAATAFTAKEWYWQRGMAPGTGIVNYKANGTNVLNEDTLVSGGFTLYDPSGQSVGSLPLLGNPVATTAISNATSPIVLTANTAGLVSNTTFGCGSVVRMSNTAAQQDTQGVDFSIGAVVLNTSFTLTIAGVNPLANVPGAVGGAGFYRVVNVDDLFYPRHRYITNITQAVHPQVSTSVPHGMTPGQEIRFSIPKLAIAPFGMTQLDGLVATVLTVVDDFNFTINVDTSAFALFVWPSVAQMPASFPIMVPVGEDTASALVLPGTMVPMVCGEKIHATQSGILADSTVNTGFLGMVLGSGGNGTALGTPIFGPAGGVHFSAADVIDVADTMYWVAGKSSFGGL